MNPFDDPAIIQGAAYLAAILFFVTTVLQVLILAGALPITMAWGGRQETLTTGLRLAGLATVLVLALFAYVILLRAGVVGQPPAGAFVRTSSWAITAFMGLNTLANLASKSRQEKLVFGPISVLLFACCLAISLSA